MFHYFAYGSNMSAAALRAKGVTPVAAEPAILDNWQLTFDIPDFFSIEGGTGNIERSDGSRVHGVLYQLEDYSRKRLDELEALGVTYDRIEQFVVSYSGITHLANVYVGLPSRLESGHLPSARYLRILIRGAEEMGLDTAYAAWLRSIETKPLVVHPPFEPAVPPSEAFSLESLAEHPLYTSLAGAVFDMSNARREHAYLQDLLGGTDVTVFFLRRMDTSTGTETLEDFVRARLSPSQQIHLNNYKHEFAREYRYVGRIDYGLTVQRSVRNVRLSAHRGIIGPRQILEKAEQTNREKGHENAGFLSRHSGFMPLQPPLDSLPGAFRPWDELASSLPKHYAGLSLRKAIDELPVLDASSESLDDCYLLRAGSALAMLSHAYFYTEVHPPSQLPAALAEPWRQVRHRLGREQEVLSYIDLIVYNWRKLDPSGPTTVENLRLMIPTVDTKEERIFYLGQVEILAQCNPIIGACVDALEASVRDDPDAVASSLITIISALENVIRTSLPKLDPNPNGPFFMDPVVWARGVAPFAVPFRKDLQGPSGTSSPIFNLLDSFLGRRHNKTFLGKEIRALRRGYPMHWRQFLESIEEHSITEYIERANQPFLTGLLKEMTDVYAGESGFLGRHRMKVYGFLELAFKVGRSVTIGGFAGMFQDRTWDEVDAELEYSRLERVESFPRVSHQAYVKSVTPLTRRNFEQVNQVVLDISQAGIRYIPGDRCGILPENEPELVAKTLASLSATGEERIPLTDEWRDAVRHRRGFQNATELVLADFLRFGRIRPVVPRVAEALHAISQNEILLHAIEEQNATRWELWDLLGILKSSGFAAEVLWRAAADAPEHICRVVPPETFRMYSISSIQQDSQAFAGEMHLTVGRVVYEDDSSDSSPALQRQGTASNFLSNAAKRSEPISFFLERPPRFALPRDPSIPIVMLAGGTGISPFRGFVLERERQPKAARSYLYLAARTHEDFYYREDFAAAVAADRLEVHVAFSREDIDVVFDRTDASAGCFSFRPGRHRYLQDVLLEETTAAHLWELLRGREEGGQGAYFYVCGRSRFAKSMHGALKKVLERFCPGNDTERSASAEAILRRLNGEGRYLQEIFTDSRTWDVQRRSFQVSDIVEHNDDRSGYWIIIDGLVYDITEFVELHPGGKKALCGYAGMNGSQGFARVHDHQSEVKAMLQLYEIGKLHRPDFQHVSRIVERQGATHTVALAALYRAWLDMLFLTVEMQNALRNDYSFQHSVTANGDPVEPRSFYKLQRAIETHERFLVSYVRGTTGQPLSSLWEMTQGLCAPGRSPRWMHDGLEAIAASESARFAAGTAAGLHAALDVLRRASDNDIARMTLIQVCEDLERLDHELLKQLKSAFREGVMVFERHQARTLDQASAEVVSALGQVPSILEAYYDACRRRLVATPIEIQMSESLLRPEDETRLEPILSTDLWQFEEDRERGVIFLTRSARPIDSLQELLEQNEQIMSHMTKGHGEYGIVVDMRQAPIRNDPAYEQAMAKLRITIARCYPRVAVLLMSSVGVLQVNRIGRHEGARTFATLSRAAAIKFAIGTASTTN